MMLPESFAGKRILLIGDVMLDRYIYGQVERISPEAPVPVLNIDRRTSSLGGAGTVLRNLSSLGAYTVFISVIGDDNAAHEITGLIGEIANTEPYLLTASHRPTTVKTRLISGHHQLARYDEETCEPISVVIAAKVNKQFLSALENCDAVIISDYAKGVVTHRDFGAKMLIEAARNKGIPCIVDPKGDDYSLYSGATVITPNIPELKLASKSGCLDTAEIIKAAHDLIAKYDLSNILVTRSKDGMTLVMKNGESYNIPSAAREVYDVTGAGDTVVAVLAIGIASGMALPDAARIANAAAAIVVGRVGTSTVTTKELEAA